MQKQGLCREQLLTTDMYVTHLHDGAVLSVDERESIKDHFESHGNDAVLP